MDSRTLLGGALAAPPLIEALTTTTAQVDSHTRKRGSTMSGNHDDDAIRAAARQTFKHHLEYLSSGRIDEWVNLFTEDGVLEFPYPPTGTPDYFKGHAALYDYMQHFPETFRLKFVNVRFHETVDPALVIAQFNSEGIAISTGKRYDQTYISVVETRDGKISHYKDFWNPLIGMAALGSSDGIPTKPTTAN